MERGCHNCQEYQTRCFGYENDDLKCGVGLPLWLARRPDWVPAPRLAYVAEYFKAERIDGTFWIEVHVDRKPYTDLGPFASPDERDRALADMMEMMRQFGATDSVIQ